MEVAQKADVVIAVPTRGSVRIEWAAMLAGLAPPINMSQILRVIPGRSVEEARNVAVDAARAVGAFYLFFIDDDVLIPNQGLRRMVHKLENEPEWDLVTGIVPVKSDPPEPAVFRGHRPGPYWGWTFDQPFEVDACGMACVLIRMSAFDRLEPPYFAWKREHDGVNTNELGEDLGFCARLQEAGGRLLADGGLLCGHITETGKVFMLDVDTAPFKRAGNDRLRKYTIIDHEKAAAT